MKVNFSGVGLVIAFLTQLYPTTSSAQSDPRNVFIASIAVKGKAILEYDAQGVQVANINIKSTTAQQFLSCNWGPDLLPIASLSLEPDVSLTLNDLAGKSVKQFKLGIVGSVVSLMATEYGNGLCDLLSFDKNGNGTIYPDTAIDGSRRDL